MSERPPSHKGPRVAEILVPVAIDQTYSYRVPDELDLATGDLVEVPLGTRQTVGAVWEIAAGARGSNLKAVTARFDIPAAQRKSAQLRRLGGALDHEPARHGVAHGAMRAPLRA